MLSFKFVIMAINRDGRQVLASERLFVSRFHAELASLDLYSHPDYKCVWVAPTSQRSRAA